MKVTIGACALFLLALALTPLWAEDGGAAGDVYYAKKTTTVKAEPKFGASVVTRLKTQQKVRVLDKSGRYWKVAVDGKEGYVYSGWLTRSSGIDLEGAVGAAAGQDVRLEDLEGSGAIRGLTAEAEFYAGASAEVLPVVKQDLEYVLRIQVRDELTEFMRAGDLGEFRGATE